MNADELNTLNRGGGGGLDAMTTLADEAEFEVGTGVGQNILVLV